MGDALTRPDVVGEAAGPAATPPAGFWRRLSRFASGVVGADKYERYLQWHRTTGQPGDPMDRKAFWRHEMDRMERNPATRCC